MGGVMGEGVMGGVTGRVMGEGAMEGESIGGGIWGRNMGGFGQ